MAKERSKKGRKKNVARCGLKALCYLVPRGVDGGRAAAWQATAVGFDRTRAVPHLHHLLLHHRRANGTPTDFCFSQKIRVGPGSIVFGWQCSKQLLRETGRLSASCRNEEVKLVSRKRLALYWMFDDT